MATGSPISRLFSAPLFVFLLLLSSPAAPPLRTAAAAASSSASAAAAAAGATPFHVGVILDRSSWIGNDSWTCISMAVEDFYAAHPGHAKRLVLHLRDSGEDTVGAAAAALDLLKNVQVQAILGPQSSAQAKFVVELGDKSQVPVISYSAKSPSLSPASSEYFVRAAMNDSSQAKAVAAVVQTFRWKEAVIIFEDTEFGNGIVSYLVDELQASDVRVPYRTAIPPAATGDQLSSELGKLKRMQTRVFIVHATCSLGLRLFSAAKAAGMMAEGYVWMTTYGLTAAPDAVGSAALGVMQGVLGVKPYVPESKRLAEFTARWKRRYRRDHPVAQLSEPSTFGLWAYDAAWAVAMAAERVDSAEFAYKKGRTSRGASGLDALGSSPIGPELLRLILGAEFDGLGGKFRVVSGQLQSATVEIVNVLDKGKRRVGFWTAATGVTRHLNAKPGLRVVVWPGNSSGRVPKGWEWPIAGETLKIGVPAKPGFNEFIDMKRNPLTGKLEGHGYCTQVFEAVLKTLPYHVPYEYVEFVDAHGQSNGTYDELVYEVYLQNFDAVVGDVTIVANRSRYVDFTLPFTESGVTMVVPVKDDNPKNAWVFARPLSGDLWLASGCFFLFTGIVVWILEHRVNPEFRGPPANQLGTIFYFAFSTLVFAHREKLVGNLSRFVVVIWVFVVLILTSSYTASLSSMLTVQQLRPTTTELGDLIARGDRIGYLNDSFMPGLLKRLNVNLSKIVAYNSPEEYARALDKGTHHGGVSAIVDEIPYLKVFLSRYCGKYTMVGPTYRADGFGFVFPKGSPLVPDVSRAILKVTEGSQFVEMEKKLYGDDECSDESSGNGGSSSSLGLNSFWGLFLITGAASAVSLVVFLFFFLRENRHVFSAHGSQTSFLQKLASLARIYDERDASSHAFRKSGGTPAGSPWRGNQPQSPSSISNHTFGDADTDREAETGTPAEGGGTPGREISAEGRRPPPPPSATR